MSDSDRSGTERWVRVALVVAVAGAVLAGAWKLGLFALEDRVALAAAIERARGTPHLRGYFVATYAIAAAVGVPATPLTLAGGALFGIELGIALNWLGEMLAAALAFLLVRATGFRFGKRTLPGEDASGVAPRGFGALLRLRLIPVVPFSMLNAGAAASGMSWQSFALATGIGIVPITVIYTASASQLVAGVEGSGARALWTALGSAGILIAITFLPALIRRGTQRRT